MKATRLLLVALVLLTFLATVTGCTTYCHGEVDLPEGMTATAMLVDDVPCAVTQRQDRDNTWSFTANQNLDAHNVYTLTLHAEYNNEPLTASCQFTHKPIRPLRFVASLEAGQLTLVHLAR